MKQRIYVWVVMLLSTVLIASCLSAKQSTDTLVLERSFKVSDKVQDPPSVVLRSMPGDLRIVYGETGLVQISAELVGVDTTPEDAKRSRETLSLDFSQEGNIVRVIGDQDILSGIDGDVWINYRITIPPNTKLDIQMDNKPKMSRNIGASSVLLFVLLIMSGSLLVSSTFFWTRLRRAQAEIQKLVFELRAARGEAHMRELEQGRLVPKEPDRSHYHE